MSLVRKSSKATLRTNVEDFSAAMDQKNSMIYSLQAELQTLRPNQQKFLRIKQELMKVKSKHECLIKDYERIVSNNADRLELSARNVQQLRIQAQHYNQELRLRVQALKEAKFSTQQLVELQNRREDESTECKIKYQEQKNTSQVLKIEEERTRLQICQMREEVDKGKRENYLIRNQNQDVNQKCYKTQSYIRGLTREEASLNENLSKIEDENQKLDSAISQLSTIIAVNQSTISDKEKDVQQVTFNIASKQLQKKKIQNEIKQKIKQLSAQKQKSRLLSEQLEQKKNESIKLDAHLEEVCSQINFIYAKNQEIEEVNRQLGQDLKVCEKHRENVSRNNKILDCEIEIFKEQSLKTITKLQQPFKNRSNNFTQTTSQLKAKWGNTSRITDYQTGDFQRRTQRN